uniref:Uncharacterized protein n=1 Tax=Micrococcus phage Kurnik TaxID=3092208 RepID=A0AAU6R6B5_9CAUD
MSEGFSSSKVLRIQQRAEATLTLVAQPMREETAMRHLRKAMHDILKITKEELDEPESH